MEQFRVVIYDVLLPFQRHSVSSNRLRTVGLETWGSEQILIVSRRHHVSRFGIASKNALLTGTIRNAADTSLVINTRKTNYQSHFTIVFLYKM